MAQRPVAVVAVGWIAPTGSVRRTWSYRHDSISIAVHEPDGLTLGIGDPAYLWCRILPEPRIDDWIVTARALVAELGPVRPIPELHRETLVVDFPVEELRGGRSVPVSQPRHVAIDELSPAGLEAARRLSCLAAAAFGNRVGNAILELTPTLAIRAGFPGTCDAPMLLQP